MFSIITNQTIPEYSQIEAQVTEMFGLMIELRQAVRELYGTSGMEEVISRLEYLYSEMEFESLALKQMTLGLNKTILTYLSCENRVCDNSEQNVLFYARYETGTNDFSDISDILNGIQI